MLLGVTSCNYLDVVPPEQPGLPDAMKTHAAAQGFLYSCYSFLNTREWQPRDYTGQLNGATRRILPAAGMVCRGRQTRILRYAQHPDHRCCRIRP